MSQRRPGPTRGPRASRTQRPAALAERAGQGPTSAHATGSDPRQARRPSWPRWPTGRLCGKPVRRSRTRPWRRLDDVLDRAGGVGRGRGRGRRPLGARRRRGEPDRHCDSSGRRRRRGGQGQDPGDRRDQPQRGARTAGVEAIETDLAELIIQLAGERPSHLLVPRSTRTGSRSATSSASGSAPRPLRRACELAEAARLHLRGGSCAPGWRSRGRTSPPPTRARSASSSPRATAGCARPFPRRLITVMGIEKAIPRFRDLEVFLQLLPRSSTGERMNPYTSFWTVSRGRRAAAVPPRPARRRANARARRPGGRPALRCIRCSACINVCPVYRQTGGHAYHSPTQARSARSSRHSSWARAGRRLVALCLVPLRCLLRRLPGADRHPVDPGMSAGRGRTRTRGHRGQVVAAAWAARSRRAPATSGLSGSAARCSDRSRATAGSRTFRPARWLRGGSSRDLPALPAQTFREWWEARDRP